MAPVHINRYVDGFGGPPGASIRPPQRPGPVAKVVAAIVVVVVVAFLAANRVDDAPSIERRTTTTTGPAR